MPVSSNTTDIQPSSSLRVGIRSTQIATGVVLVTLLAALGVAAVRNADARDREVSFIQQAEITTTELISAQRQAIVLVDSIDAWQKQSTGASNVDMALNNLLAALKQGIEADPLINDVVTDKFDAALSIVSDQIQVADSPDSGAINEARSIIVRESRTWLSSYQSTAVSQMRVLSENRATNERNQAVLLFLCLGLSVWLLSWIAISVANTYQRARSLIASEESKVASARSALQHASDQLTYQAQHDALTGLANRTALMSVLSSALAATPTKSVTVFFCDLDRFKVVNDSLGHAMGDELLVEAAARLSKTIRETDFVARFGGDEFVVVCEDIEDKAAALRTAERISRALSKPFDMHGQDAFIGVSIGIAFSRHDSTANQLLRDADVAMYRAKAQPFEHIEFFDAAGDSFSYRFDTENALRYAIAHHQLLLHWQPIVHLRSGQVHTLEALVRWDRPGSGILMPGEFMSIAEDSGLIIDLGRWVIRAACTAGALTEDRAVSVNVSPKQLRDVRFVDDLRDILNETGLAPERLILELTEHTLIDAAVVSAPLRRVRELGIRVALDDFGTGYSSLALLSRLPIDIIKLDRAFLREITTNDANQAVIKSMVALAQALNLMLIVEGVESDAQRKTLRSLGVTHGQGYWFGQPEPDRFSALVARATSRSGSRTEA